MVELLLTDVDEVVLQRLRERANRHGRTPEKEASVILAETVDPWKAVDEIRERLAASGRIFCDSAELLREDRDR